MQTDPNPNPTPDPRFNHLPPSGFGRISHARLAAFGAPNAAKYKTMSPARLPISRSPCLTVPPGLSPGALLESPVLLTNIKAEPSPTTGTYSFHATVSDCVGSSSSCSPRGNSKKSTYDEKASSDFEFKPHINFSSRSCLSSLGPPASANPTQQEKYACLQIYSSPTQTLEPSQLVQADTVHSSHELTLSMTTSDSSTKKLEKEADVTDEIDSDEMQEIKDSDSGIQALQSDTSGSPPSIVVEKSLEDGYHWRKYGQKHVKGSEFPRNYYKCTHPNCQMKKYLECSQDGQITEVIYKGQHDHPKPEPSRRVAVGTVFSGEGEERFNRLSSLPGGEEKLSNAHCIDPKGTSEHSPLSVSDDDVDARFGGPNHNGDSSVAAADDDPESKRRKMDVATHDATYSAKTNREPRVVVQTVSEVDILDDGYRWRKYGQKVVKGNPNPRSYYKCTNLGCTVRKHVERASHDPRAVITTYEGKHNHDVPAARNSSHDTATPAMMSDGCSSINGHMPTMTDISRTTTYDTFATSSHRCPSADRTDTISLDLGVGVTANHGDSEATTENLQQAPGIDQLQNHKMQRFVGSDFSRMTVKATAPVTVFYGSSSSGLNGPREGKGDGFSFKTLQLNHSSELYYPNTENLVMGP